MSRTDVVCVGGVMLDMIGTPYKPLIRGVSNPGQIRRAHGGVARNVAHNLCLLGRKVSLVTAFGADSQAQGLMEECQGLGMDIGASRQFEGERSSTILFIEDERGEMQLGLADLSIYDRLTSDFFLERMELLDKAGAVVLDTNLPQESIETIVKKCQAPVFMDPVSAARAERMLPVLGGLYAVKPNRAEAARLTGVEINGMEGVREAAEVFLSQGIRLVCITLGAEGVYCATPEKSLHLPCRPQEVVADTGAGDAFLAAVVWAHQEGLGLEETARAAMAASALALSAPQAVNPAMSPGLLRKALAEME